MALSDILGVLEANQMELAEDLMRQEWNQSDPADVFYRIIRSGEVPVLVLLQSLKLCTERDVFVHCSNAMHELVIRQVNIAEEMYMYLLRLFASYGLRHFCGNLNSKQVNDVGRKWTDSIDLAVGWIDELRKRERWFDYLSVDNEVVYRMRMIHNELFFIKDHKALKELPLKETIFCLAIFVTSTNNCPGDFLYKTILNQRNMVQFLIAVSEDLKMVKKNEKPASKRHVLKKLIKTYRKIKQIRSVMKLVQNVPVKLDEFTERDFKRAKASTTMAAFKRFVQIFGEAIKNTLDSPNFPKKLNKILKNLFRDSLSLNSKFRDLSSHGYPLSNLYTREFNQIYFYRHMKQYMMVIAISSLIFSVYIFHDCTQNLFGLMRRATTIEEVRALVRYAGSHKIHINQKIALNFISRYVEYYKYVLELNSYSDQDFMKGTYENYYQKLEAVQELNKVHKEAEIYMHMIQIAAFANASIQSIHTMLDSKLHVYSSKDLFEKISSQWLTDESIDSKDFYTETAIHMQKYIHQRIEFDHTYSNQWICRKETSKIFSNIIAQSTDGNDTLEKLKSHLHDNLISGYYQNIFGLDSKAQAITKCLKEYFTGPKDSTEFKTRNREFKSILERIHREDEALLEHEFKMIVQKIQNVFIDNNCGTFDSFCKNFTKIPLKFRLALEYWQMQAMEILIKTKHFGDNFSTLKRSLPMIWGKTYRNYLAHDSVSYNLLTVSDVTRGLVNGFVLAFDSDGLKIFTKARDFDLQGFVTIEEKGFEWIGTQVQLLQSYRYCDEIQVNYCLQKNADTWGRFYHAPGRFLIHRAYSIAEILAHETFHAGQIDPAVVELSKNDLVYSRIITRGEINTNLLLNLEQFDYLDITEAIDQFQLLQPDLKTPCIGAVLKFLAESGNLDKMQILLEDYEDHTESILNLSVGYSASGKEFFNPLITMDSSMLNHFFQTQRDEAFSAENLQLIVRSNNVEALEKALQYERKLIAESVMEEVVITCLSVGRLNMIKILLASKVKCNISLIMATHHHRWDIAEHLLDIGINPWIEEGFIIFVSLHEQNFKLVRSIVRRSFPKEFHSNVIRYVARQGSLKLMTFILNRTVDLWYCEGIMECALQNSNPKVVKFLLEKIFKPNDNCSDDPELNRWVKILNELRILEFLNSEPTVIRTATEHNLEVAEWLTDQIFSFFWTKQSGAIIGDAEDCNESSPSLRTIALCSTLIHQVQELPKELHLKTVSFNVTFINRDREFNASIELTVKSPSPISDFNDDCHKIAILPSNHFMNAVLMSLRDLILKHADVALAKATVTILSGIGPPECFRMLHTKSSSCIIQDTTRNCENNIGVLSRIPNFSVLDILPVNASTSFLQNLLTLGADPLLLRSTNRNSFHNILLENRSLEHIDLIYQHCVKSNRIHLPDGVHVFNLADVDGLTPLSYAVRSNNCEAVDYLLQNGAEPMVADREGEAGILRDAILNLNIQMVLLLLKYSPQLINKPVNTERSESVLEKAVEINHFRMVQLMLEHGASLHHRNENGMTAVGVAIRNQAVESLKVMLDFADKIGESIEESVTVDGQSALELARDENDPEILSLLVARTPIDE